MKKIFLILAMLALTVPVFAFDFFKGTYAEALKKAKDENKKVLLYFTAKWCGPCRYMDIYVFSDESVSQYAKDKYVALKLDIDTEAGKRIFFKYDGKTGVPGFYIVTPEENILKQIGGMNLKQLFSFLEVVETPAIAMRPLSDEIALVQVNKSNKLLDSLLEKNPSLANSAKFAGRAKPDSVANLAYEEQANKEWSWMSRFFMANTFNRWKPGLKLGFNMSTLEHSAIDTKSIPGYYGGLFFDFTSTKGTFLFQPGIQFNSRGGSVSGVTTRFHYLEIPLLMSYKIARGFVIGHQSLRLNVIPYGAINMWTSQRTTNSSAVSAFSNISSIKKFDYGTKLGFSFALGTLEPFFGYDFGFANISNTPGYKLSNRSYYISFAMIVGK